MSWVVLLKLIRGFYCWQTRLKISYQHSTTDSISPLLCFSQCICLQQMNTFTFYRFFSPPTFLCCLEGQQCLMFFKASSTWASACTGTFTVMWITKGLEDVDNWAYCWAFRTARVTGAKPFVFWKALVNVFFSHVYHRALGKVVSWSRSISLFTSLTVYKDGHENSPKVKPIYLNCPSVVGCSIGQ